MEASEFGIELFEKNLSAIGRELADWYRVLPNELVDAVNDLMVQKIEDDANKSISVTGSQFKSLHPEYRDMKQAAIGSYMPDLHLGVDIQIMGDGSVYTEPKPSAFKNFYLERLGTKNKSVAFFDGDFGYMTDHQRGENGMPQRKFFPTEDAEFTSNPNYAGFVDRVGKMILEYLDLKARGEKFKHPSDIPRRKRM